jgi:hypothetical protein
MNVGEFIQQFHHAVIIFEAVHAHPWHAIFSGNQVLVEGLMLMPKKNHAESWHGWNG